MNKETNYWKTAEQMNGRLAMMGFFAALLKDLMAMQHCLDALLLWVHMQQPVKSFQVSCNE